jgi:hypothetical protein
MREWVHIVNHGEQARVETSRKTKQITHMVSGQRSNRETRAKDTTQYLEKYATTNWIYKRDVLKGTGHHYHMKLTEPEFSKQPRQCNFDGCKIEDCHSHCHATAVSRLLTVINSRFGVYCLEWKSGGNQENHGLWSQMERTVERPKAKSNKVNWITYRHTIGSRLG